MPVNYSLLKESEIEIMSSLKDFFSHVINTLNQVCEQIKTGFESYDEILDTEEYEKIDTMIQKSIDIKNDLLSDCIWLIQKNEPRASHLRFIIAIIYSTKNLLNISESTKKIAKFFYKSNVKIDLFKEYITIFEQTIIISKKISTSISNHDIEMAQEELKEDLEQYHYSIHELVNKGMRIQNCINTNVMSNEYLVNFIININRLERIIEFQENILSDFAQINKSH